MLIGAIAHAGNTAFNAFGNSFTASTAATANNSSANETQVSPGFRVVSATGAYTTSGTLSASVPWAAAIATYKADNTAPAAPSTPDMTAGTDSGSSNSDDVTNDTTPTVGGTAQPNSTVTIFDGVTSVGTGTATSAGAYTITTSVLSNGVHSLSAKASDGGGANVSASSGVLSATIDNVAPAVPSVPDLTAATDSGFSSTDNITNDNTPDFTGTAEAGATVTLRETATSRGTGVATGGTYTITSSTLATGGRPMNALATDIAGNSSTASANLTVTIDTTVPTGIPSVPNLDAGSDSGTSNTDNITNDNTPTFSGTGSPNGVHVQLREDTTTHATSAAVAGGAYSVTAPVLSDGVHALKGRYMDAAGNVSATESATLSVTIDTAIAAPSIPDLSAATDSGASTSDDITNDNTPTFTGTAEAGATVRIFDNAVQVGTGTAAGGSYSITTSTLADGTNKPITANATDVAGNNSATSSGLPVTIDLAAPVAPSIPDLTAATDLGSSSTDNITKDNTPDFTGTAEAGVTVTLRENTTSRGTTTATGGTYTITSSTLADGSRSMNALATDLAGNAGPASGSLAVTIDTAAPATPSVPDLDAASDSGSSVIDNITSDTTPTFSGTTGAATTVTILDGATVRGSVAAAGTTYSVTASPALADGVHPIKARATDVAGNDSASDSATLSITIDTTDPAAPSTPDMTPQTDLGSSSTDNVTADATPDVTGTAEADSTVTLFVDNAAAGTMAATGGSYAFTLPTQSGGEHEAKVQTTDGAGNTSAESGTLEFTIDTTAPSTPTIDDSDPDSPDNVNDPEIKGTAEAGSVVRLYTLSDCTGGVSGTPTGAALFATPGITVTVAADSTTVFYASARDAAGNDSGCSAGFTYVEDSDAPAAPSTPDLATANDTGSSNTDNITKDDTPLLTGTAEAGSTVRIFDGATQVGSGTATGGSYSIVISSLSDGSHSLHATATDASGNGGSDSGALGVTIDTIDPAAPSQPDLTTATDSGSSDSDNLTNDTTPDLQGTAETDSTVKLFEGATQRGSGIATGGSYTITTSALSAGAHSIKANTTDVAGNTSTDSSALSITIDVTAPAAPSAPDLAALSDTGTSNTDNITKDDTPDLQGTAVSGSTVKLFEGATLLGSGAATGGNWTITATLADGSHTLKATATDVAGNESGDSSILIVTIDTTAPAAPTTPNMTAATDKGASSTDNVTNDNTPIFSGDAETSSTVKLYDNGTQVGSGLASSPYSITTSSLADGVDKPITADATDVAGNTGPASSALLVTIDTIDPSAPAITDSDPNSPANFNDPKLKGTSAAGTVSIFGATCIGSPLNSASNSVFANPGIEVNVTDDTDTAFVALTTDPAGNDSACSGPFTYVEDSTDPTAPVVVHPGGGALLNAAGFTAGCTPVGEEVCGTAADPGGSGVAQVEVSIERESDGMFWDGADFTSATEVLLAATGTTSWSLPLPTASLTDGDFTIRARAEDLGGSTGQFGSATFSFDSTVAPPNLTSSPAPDPGNDATPEWGFDGEAGSTFECTLDRPAPAADLHRSLVRLAQELQPPRRGRRLRVQGPPDRSRRQCLGFYS